ncbi:uncharacterized protein NECHADRAFT_87734 [Fusarium vanettenii 77-13-4]|uniref:Hedgehog/Intein (Hint) domain-containing protein n=1 Tax=Fusarium vanettenii (strain ATCC MYA-4622 / CBS 123669 / FGSC 9596 / NRRL 45880 / 77-13-4) TaxID=660122 RepID=C7Z2V9_FUSV7|nr:uncharacterized protein NECHADRAFT_87734 [Fusarium vanettenii 77-13-4]EEU41549.1 predicted protein [Fusarium vanettenii 77-13-4]
MADSYTTKVQNLLTVLGRVTMLDETEVVLSLQTAFLTTSSMSALKTYFQAPPASGSCTIDGVDLTDTIESLGNAAIAAQIADCSLEYGFSSIANRDVAVKLPGELFNTIMPCVFGNHINGQLHADGLLPLQVLRQDPTFVTTFESVLVSPQFDPFRGQGDYYYAMMCLFVYVYLIKGPGFALDTTLEMSPALTIIRAWQSNLTAPTTPNLNYLTALQFDVVFNAYTPSGIYSPTRNADATLLDFAQAVQNEGLMTIPTADASTGPEPVPTNFTDGSIFAGVDVSQFSPVSYRLWKKWMGTLDDQSPGNFWRAGIMAAAAQTLETNKSDTIPSGGGEPPVITLFHFVTHGKDLADWYKNHQDEPYMNSDINLNNTTETTESGAQAEGKAIMGCFVAGTKVETSNGAIAIEYLREGDQILTRAGGAQQWGTRSDEVVENPSPATLYGFNGEAPFFTAGHPFFTATGLRSIDPETARKENPWLEVGQLKPGHVLLRLNAEKGYDRKVINSINMSRSDVTSVYGVHLREGLRSYHANGYLVAINYPEITAVSITRQLKTFPPAQRAAIIQSLGVLKPLFERFGAGTVMDKLIKETGST